MIKEPGFENIVSPGCFGIISSRVAPYGTFGAQYLPLTPRLGFAEGSMHSSPNRNRRRALQTLMVTNKAGGAVGCRARVGDYVSAGMMTLRMYGLAGSSHSRSSAVSMSLGLSTYPQPCSRCSRR
jgi:hypothetical protein